jgi:ferrous iron transport protein A
MGLSLSGLGAKMKIIFSGGSVSRPSVLLSELPVGGRAYVVAIDGTPELAARLTALGFLPRTEVCCRRRAPLGDPRVYELRGTQLCLRRTEARSVRVELA